MIKKLGERSGLIITLLSILVFSIIFVFKPELIMALLDIIDEKAIILILFYLPGFFLLTGLFEVWLPKKMVTKKLGKESGWKGLMYSFMLGAIFPGPLYIAFPIAAVLKKKGVSMLNLGVFVSAWSCFKISEEIFELQFLGPRFMILRVLITIPFVFIIALIIDKLNVPIKLKTFKN